MYTSTIDLKTLSNLVIKLMMSNSVGVFNIGSNQILSKKDFALKYFKKCKVHPSYFDLKTNNDLKTSMNRGRFLGLSVKKIEKKLNIKMPNSNKVINNLFHENIRN